MIQLKALRQKRGIKQKDICALLNIAQNTYSQYETGSRQPDIETLKRLAEYFNVSTDELLDKAPPKRAVRINVLGRIPAGTPVEAVEDILDWEEIPEKWTESGAEYFALQVTGDSMYPKYLEKDIIICRKQSDCDSGQDAIVFVNGSDATLKKLIKKENGLVLQPLNIKYDHQSYSFEEVESLPVTVLGIVVEIRRKV